VTDPGVSRGATAVALEASSEIGQFVNLFRQPTIVPGRPLVDLSAPYAVGGAAFIHVPAGWESGGHYHPPRRNFFITLQGELEIETSDGEGRAAMRGGLRPSVPVIGGDGLLPVSLLFERAGPAARGTYVSINGLVNERLGLADPDPEHGRAPRRRERAAAGQLHGERRDASDRANRG